VPFLELTHLRHGFFKLPTKGRKDFADVKHLEKTFDNLSVFHVQIWSLRPKFAINSFRSSPWITPRVWKALAR